MFRPEPGAVVARPDLTVPDDAPPGPLHAKDTEQYHVCLGGPGAAPRATPSATRCSSSTPSWAARGARRLFQEVREKRGLAYSVYSYTSLYADAGLTAVYFGSREEAVDEAMSVILDELSDLEARRDRRRPSSAPRTTSRASSC